ncbi:DUF2934 domain-containing protein [Falsirhodobacter sp. 20TX0035]|uniref:DUF2934 domain-containing protein n=1 Tax=Falsirhodobacter sp. 20TX0035 TaxID=3022019 RepID=UPI00232C4502|nr:DUF2934 domain-containing protein [Falsirhodobacter sp. 20TX0035]MDB6452824.1 DUF2934 domain-containing protein [Falsirhodobacter sp. 20TX0035]
MDRDNAIRTRAHQLWEEEGQPHGRHEEHWNRAKEELDIPEEGGEVGGMLGGQSRDAAPTALSGSVEGSADKESEPAKPKRGKS